MRCRTKVNNILFVKPWVSEKGRWVMENCLYDLCKQKKERGILITLDTNILKRPMIFRHILRARTKRRAALLG
jgi:hypothetical protein